MEDKIDRRKFNNDNYVTGLETDITDLKDEIKQWQDSWDILTKENVELKQQLQAVKYLNRKEVEKIFKEANTRRGDANQDFIDGYNDTPTFEEIEQDTVTAICNLAIPENLCKMKIYKDGKIPKSDKP